jgi:hypothetical protein
MRLSIIKKHHQQLLIEVAASLRTDDPKDALEHILNCWIHPCFQLPQEIALAQGASISRIEVNDSDSIASWD